MAKAGYGYNGPPVRPYNPNVCMSVHKARSELSVSVLVASPLAIVWRCLFLNVYNYLFERSCVAQEGDPSARAMQLRMCRRNFGHSVAQLFLYIVYEEYARDCFLPW